MGKGCTEPAEEDELCAVYLQSLLEGHEMPDIEGKLQSLAKGGGKHFFDPALREIFPEKDFWMCIDCNRFDFVLRIERDQNGLIAKKTGVAERQH
jgi:2-phosphosulfolactate phosphatase